jgi:hypothetical protein
MLTGSHVPGRAQFYALVPFILGIHVGLPMSDELFVLCAGATELLIGL